MTDVRRHLALPSGVSRTYHSLPLLEQSGVASISRQSAVLTIERRDGRSDSVTLLLRIDTPIEAAYFSAGGIMPYLLEQLLADGARMEPAS